MKLLKWSLRKFTFVVIADANNSVVRFRLRSIFIYLIPVIALASAAAIFLLYRLYADYSAMSAELETKLHAEIQRYESTISEKDKAIEDLKIDVVDLTDQTKQVSEKLEELKQISDQIKSITGEDSTAAATSGNNNDDANASVAIAGTSEAAGDALRMVNKPVSIASFTDPSEPIVAPPSIEDLNSVMKGLPYAQGGVYEEATTEDILQLAQDTISSLAKLDTEMANIKFDLEEAKELAIEHQYIISITPSIWPTISTRVTSGYGYRKDPFTGRASYHSGIDFGASYGDPIYATANGKVIEASYDSSEGNHVVIDHSNGLRTIYMHMSKILVEVGDTVEKGDTIGKVGTTGRSTGPHVHYEMMKWGTVIDPGPYLPSK